jgi:hypothetical protein
VAVQPNPQWPHLIMLLSTERTRAVEWYNCQRGFIVSLLRRTYSLYSLSQVISCMLHVPAVHNLKLVAVKHSANVPSQILLSLILYVVTIFIFLFVNNKI